MWHVIRLDETPSTSTHLKQLAEAGAPAGTVVITQRQTGGHGRRGRSWLAPPGALLMSALLRPAEPCPLLSLAVGVAVHEALALPALHLKWPNDLLCGTDKCGGILVEGRWSGQRPEWYVIGLGLNVGAPPALSGTTCLADHGGSADPEAVLPGILASLTRWTEPAAMHPDRLLPAWKAACGLWGQSVNVFSPTGESWSGTVVDVAEDGGLIVCDAQGRHHTLQSGEISLTAADARQPLD